MNITFSFSIWWAAILLTVIILFVARLCVKNALNYSEDDAFTLIWICWAIIATVWALTFAFAFYRATHQPGAFDSSATQGGMSVGRGISRNVALQDRSSVCKGILLEV